MKLRTPHGLIRSVLGLILASLCWAAMAQTAEVQEVNRLIRARQLDQALQKAEAGLAQRPDDAQLRFLKGLVFSEQNKPDAAIAVFLKLTEDRPELPEPYNNLAVLYAGKGQYDKARAALEMALRVHPNYGTAHENLGDVYAKLASESYNKAVQLDPANSAAKSKLTQIREMVGTPPAPSKSAPPSSAPATQAQPTAAKPALPAAPVAVAAPTQSPHASRLPAAAPTDAAPATPAESEVIKTVQAWAQAWSARDVNGYLAFYAKDFEVPRGMRRTTWQKERQRRIREKDKIRVRIERLNVALDGEQATARFVQHYRGGKLHMREPKTLQLKKVGTRWKIQQESQGHLGV